MGKTNLPFYRILKSVLFALIFSWPVIGSGQNELPVLFEQQDLLTENKIEFPKTCTDSMDLAIRLKKVLEQLRLKSFLTTDLDSIRKIDNVFRVWIHPGPSFSWLDIEPGNLSPMLLESLGINTLFYRRKPIYFPEVANLMNKIIDHYSNHGYPFASVRLDSVMVENDQISAKLQLEKNKIFRFDSINIISSVQISQKYLENLLQIRKGTLFNLSKVRLISKKINNLPFISLEEQPSVNFKGNRVIVNLKLKARNTSRFDVLIGIVPDNTGENKIRITGDIITALYNKLGQGEYAGFRYKSYTNNRQELSLNLDYPYFFQLPFGINTSFDLFRNTDANRDLHFDFGVNYQIKQEKDLKIFWNLESSRLLRIDTAQLIQEKKLPASLDVETNGLGISFSMNRLNYRYNPRSGFAFSLSAMAGRKKVLPNLEIQSIKSPGVDFRNSYDTLSSGYQFSVRGGYDHFFPMGNVFALKLSNRSGHKIAEQGLFLNESFRIGGSQLLRGFNEESLYATTYSVFTLEPRLLISSNSFFFVFMDYGWIFRQTSGTSFRDRPYGIGTGLSFDTGAGILLISAAVGSQMGGSLDFNSSKVHVGYVSLF